MFILQTHNHNSSQRQPTMKREASPVASAQNDDIQLALYITQAIEPPNS